MTFNCWRRIAIWSIRLLLLAVLAIIALAIVVLTVIPRATHGTALTVLTGSMTPGIPVGSVVIDRPVDPGTLHVGDIATYQKEAGKAEYITHRVVKINNSTTPTTFTFKGDANRGPDLNPVPATAIRGKVWFHVPYLGSIRDALHTKGGLAGVAMLLLAGYALYQGASALRDRGRPQPSENFDNLELDLDRAQPQFALLMQLRRDAFAGLAPEAVARSLGVALVESDDDKFTLLAAHAERARDALELIDALESSAGDHGDSDRDTEESELPFEPDWNPLAPDYLGVLVTV
jgi:signal peptidase